MTRNGRCLKLRWAGCSADLVHECMNNKAGYTATLVACGWAGALFELLKHLGKCSEAKDRKNIKKVKWGPTDRPTNQPTDRPTDRPTDGQSGV